MNRTCLTGTRNPSPMVLCFQFRTSLSGTEFSRYQVCSSISSCYVLVSLQHHSALNPSSCYPILLHPAINMYSMLYILHRVGLSGPNLGDSISVFRLLPQNLLSLVFNVLADSSTGLPGSGSMTWYFRASGKSSKSMPESLACLRSFRVRRSQMKWERKMPASSMMQQMYKMPPRTSKVCWATRAMREKKAPSQSKVRNTKSTTVSDVILSRDSKLPTDSNYPAAAFNKFWIWGNDTSG
jgi:hypothetical protein